MSVIVANGQAGRKAAEKPGEQTGKPKQAEKAGTRQKESKKTK